MRSLAWLSPALVARRLPAVSRLTLACLAVLALGLLPRLIALDRVPTVDEPLWQPRTLRFFQALAAGDFAATYQSGHPGVTTMWLGSLALLAQRWLGSLGLLTDLDAAASLALMRVPLAVVSGLAPLAGYLLLRRILAPPAALLAALLWALDPFLVAHARVLHLDALLTAFMALSMLALLAALADAASQAPSRIVAASPPVVLAEAPPGSAPLPLARGTGVLLALSGVLAGLALLTKQPSLFLLPLAALVVGLWAWRQRGAPAARAARAARLLLAWGLIALATVVALWPALWVTPLETLARLVAQGRLEAGQGHSNGNYFLGQPDPAPGVLFYLVALPLRLTPWALVGLLLPVAFARARAHVRELIGARELLLLVAYAVGFACFMTLSPKKFDRYLLPVFPVVEILAAVGLVATFRWIASKRRAGSEGKRGLPAGAIFAITLAAAATVWFYHPNHLAYYNPLLGGGRVAQWALPVGWGEGIDEAREWLNARAAESHARIAVAARSNALLGRGAGFDVVALDDLPAPPADFPNYAMLYISNVQRQRLPPEAQWYLENVVPAQVVRLHGIDYAWIYQVPPPVPVALPARFGEAIALRGYGLNPPKAPGEAAQLALFWQGLEAAPADYMLFAHLIGPDGERYAQVDLPPGGEVAPTSAWGAGRFYITGLALPLPAGAPPGSYRVVVGLYEPATGRRISPQGTPPADPALAGADALELARFELQ